MGIDDNDASTWEPTASIVISGVAALLAGTLAIVVARWAMTAPRQGGMEHLGDFVLTLAAWAGMLAASVVGMIAAGIGLHRSRIRGVRTPALRVTFAANLGEFFLVFLLPLLRM
jgi:hypothetical protein